MSLYPSLENLNNDGEIDKNDLKELIDNKIYKERLFLMDYKKDEFINKIDHQLKNKNNYNKISTGVKITGITSSIGLAIVAIVFTSGIAAPLFIVPLCGGLTLFSIGVSESLQKLLKGKKQNIRKTLMHLKDIVSKLEVFIEKAKDDKKIDLNEIEAFNKLVRTDIKQLHKGTLTKEEQSFLEEALKNFIQNKANVQQQSNVLM